MGLATGTGDDGRVVLGNDDAFLRLAKVIPGDTLELDSEILGDHATTGEDSDVLRASPCDDRRSPEP